MKTASLIFILGGLLISAVFASASLQELERITVMQETLSKSGVAGLLSKVREEQWRVPHMPSHWHVENVTQPEQRPIDEAARALGKAILVQLTELAPRLQQLPAGEELYRLTRDMFDLTDWCWGTEGYGNLLLAQRTIDLATVGMARLAYDLQFPIEKCAELADRLEFPWNTTATRVRLLNKEAGAELFPPDLIDQETLIRMWGTGWFLREEQRNPNLRKTLSMPLGPVPQLKETPLMRERLAFFEQVESAFRPKPGTVLVLWDVKLHDMIARGVVAYNYWNILWAKSLVAFRRLVGQYPERITWTDEQIRTNESSIAEHAKLGISISKLETDPEVLGRMGFEQALRSLSKPENASEAEWQERLRAAGTAWPAYSLLRKGEFIDEDTKRQKYGHP